MIHISERRTRFAQTAREALESEAGPDALDTICRAYGDDLTAVAAELAGVGGDLRATAMRQRTADDMVRTLHAVVTAEILRTARVDAYAQQLGRVVSRVRTVVATAREVGEASSEAGAADALALLTGDLEAALTEPVDAPAVAPAVVAFVPEPDRSRVGHFQSPDGAVTTGYPLVGWSLVVRQGDGETRRLEPTFLVEDRALPESFLRETYRVELRQLI